MREYMIFFIFRLYKMGDIYFVSFGGPSVNYHNALQRVCKEAKTNWNIYKNTRIYGYLSKKMT